MDKKGRSKNVNGSNFNFLIEQGLFSDNSEIPPQRSQVPY